MVVTTYTITRKNNMFNKTAITIFVLIALLGMNTSFAMSHKSTGIVIQDPWVRSAPPNAPALGAFMQIHNNTNQDVKLISAHAKAYGQIQLHRTINDNGMMRMVEQEFMPILANKKLHLKPGSWHIMLINPDRVPNEGEVVALKLLFNNGTSQIVNFKVRKGQMMMKNHQHSK